MDCLVDTSLPCRSRLCTRHLHCKRGVPIYRLQAEGPASHRKKDLLDKATKEAEHREQLRELSARLTSLSDCIAADEANKIRYADK